MLERYARSIAEVAQSRGAWFIDLFEPFRDPGGRAGDHRRRHPPQRGRLPVPRRPDRPGPGAVGDPGSSEGRAERRRHRRGRRGAKLERAEALGHGLRFRLTRETLAVAGDEVDRPLIDPGLSLKLAGLPAGRHDCGSTAGPSRPGRPTTGPGASRSPAGRTASRSSGSGRRSTGRTGSSSTDGGRRTSRTSSASASTSRGTTPSRSPGSTRWSPSRSARSPGSASPCPRVRVDSRRGRRRPVISDRDRSEPIIERPERDLAIFRKSVPQRWRRRIASLKSSTAARYCLLSADFRGDLTCLIDTQVACMSCGRDTGRGSG